ncbi:hypothetical protein GPECTOR_14g79 [Gonium pectorale]|uniref:Uncharacterized protein n=1 Tax=Gonium pectorale TaxID=33097 RepID=A0A150GMK1_GONPE|nr:hypothetical protein GPECTOR_14g79 [Gonium pectorale]|eukprot:KXZ51096.1 hypothetical protein GPECTOR_14g79 [Gonium pectorale]
MAEKGGLALAPHHFDEHLYDADYLVPGDHSLLDNPLFDPLYRVGMTSLQCGDPRAGPLPGLCLAPHAPMLAQLLQPLFDDDYGNDFGSAVHGEPEAMYGPAGGGGVGGGGGDYSYPYVPYTDRIIFSPIAALINVPYPVSLYAGVLYLAEADPTLTAEGQAARAGLLLDYYFETNYYTPFTFTRVGPSTVATVASTARSRGQIGVAAKARALGQALLNYQRSRYLDNSVQLAFGTRGFAGSSLGAYLFNSPLINNQFLLQGPDLGPLP